MVSSAPSATSRAALAGIGLMLAGIFLFSFNDALGKWLVATYTVGQVLLIRSIAALLVWRRSSPASAWPTSGRSRGSGACSCCGCCFRRARWRMLLVATIYLPLADTVTFYLAAPIYVTALSALLLREQVGWRRWSAVVVGFVGVVIALNPSGAT